MKSAVTTIILFIFAFFVYVPNSYAADCKKGDRVYPDIPADQPKGNHRYNGETCSYSGFNENKKCIAASGSKYWVYYCAGGCEVQYDVQANDAPFSCNRPDPGQSEFGKIFGQINAPQQIQNLGFGAAGISKFLSNLITLIYSLAAVVLVLIILWGAWDWMTSEGDKEKLENARKKLINAIIGIMLFAVAFAVIQVLGTFTGFTFFEGQKK